MKKPYELIEHTADIFVKAYGETMAEAFAAVAEAMFALIVDESPIAERDRREFAIEAIDRENLLVRFLSELIVIHEIDGLVFGRFDVTIENDCCLRCTAWGEPFDDQKHEHGLMIKAVSYHLMEIVERQNGEPAFVKVLFDI